MSPSLASFGQFASRIPGGVEQADQARAQAALDDASALIRAEAGTTWTNEDGTALVDVPDIIVTITVAAARRSFVNPDGLTAEAIGDYSSSFAHASGDVYLTKAERNAVRRAAGRSGLWTLATTRTDVGPDTPTVIPDGWEIGGVPAESDPFGEGWTP